MMKSQRTRNEGLGPRCQRDRLSAGCRRIDGVRGGEEWGSGTKMGSGMIGDGRRIEGWVCRWDD